MSSGVFFEIVDLFPMLRTEASRLDSREEQHHDRYDPRHQPIAPTHA